jgi:hypothetical protein
MVKEKQPLRVETGWKVTWNTFNKVAPFIGCTTKVKKKAKEKLKSRRFR